MKLHGMRRYAAFEVSVVCVCVCTEKHCASWSGGVSN